MSNNISLTQLSARINHTIKFSSVDGPGNRFVIFFQGCNLNCVNCHNPQTIGFCNLCGVCIKNCPKQALSFNQERTEIICNLNVCNHCDLCIQNCVQNFDPRSQLLSVEQVLEMIRPVTPFLSGITVSGGESTLQAGFLFELFSAIKQDKKLNKLTCFVDSNGIAKKSVWEKLLPVMDKGMIDLKALDPAIHKKVTGSDNHLVLETIKTLYSADKLEEIRLLIIKGLNDSVEQIQATAKFIAALSLEIKIRVIPFRTHGIREEFKYLKATSPECIEQILDILSTNGLKNTYLT